MVFYTPKTTYLHLIFADILKAWPWWWKSIWKLKCPMKARVFMWCLLENKIPTWDNLQKRQKEGPSWCTLCKNVEESMAYMLLSFPFIMKIWVEFKLKTDIATKWHGESFLEASNHGGNKLMIRSIETFLH